MSINSMDQLAEQKQILSEWNENIQRIADITRDDLENIFVTNGKFSNSLRVRNTTLETWTKIRSLAVDIIKLSCETSVFADIDNVSDFNNFFVQGFELLSDPKAAEIFIDSFIGALYITLLPLSSIVLDRRCKPFCKRVLTIFFRVLDQFSGRISKHTSNRFARYFCLKVIHQDWRCDSFAAGLSRKQHWKI